MCKTEAACQDVIELEQLRRDSYLYNRRKVWMWCSMLWNKRPITRENSVDIGGTHGRVVTRGKLAISFEASVTKFCEAVNSVVERT